MKNRIRVTLLEDNPEYSEVVKLALNEVPDIELISQFGTSEIAVRTLEASSPEDLPDLVLLDLRLPGRSGLDTISALRTCAPDAKIIVLTQSDNEGDVIQAISLGASGYLLKSGKLDELIAGIRTVAEGGAPIDAGVAKFLLKTFQAKFASDEGHGPLSDREQEVLSLLADGMVKKEIARHLEIGYSTVDTHVGRIYAKLNVTNAPAAVNKAHRLGIFPREE